MAGKRRGAGKEPEQSPSDRWIVHGRAVAGTSFGVAPFAVGRLSTECRSKRRRLEPKQEPGCAVKIPPPEKNHVGSKCSCCHLVEEWETVLRSDCRKIDGNVTPPLKLTSTMLEAMVAAQYGGLVPMCSRCTKYLQQSTISSSSLRREERMMKNTQDVTTETDHGREVAPDLVVWLFSYGYNISGPVGGGDVSSAVVSDVLPYDTSAYDFLQQLDDGHIPAGVLGACCNTELRVGGKLFVDVLDYRADYMDLVSIISTREVKPAIRRLELSPTVKTMLPEIKMVPLEDRGHRQGWSDREWVGIESRLMRLHREPICLEPSTLVFGLALVANYNDRKFNLLKCASNKSRLIQMDHTFEDGAELEVDSGLQLEPIAIGFSKQWSASPAGGADKAVGPIPRARRIPTFPKLEIPSVDSGETVVRTLEFSSTSMKYGVASSGAKIVQMYRSTDGMMWKVSIDSTPGKSVPGSVLWHAFGTHREAQNFCNELKTQFTRHEHRQLLSDELAEYAARVGTALGALCETAVLDDGAEVSL